MRPFVRRLFSHRVFPNDFSIATADGEDNKSVRDPWLNAASRQMLCVSADADRYCSHEVDPITPHHRRS
jgi:hypothetical protein